MCHGDVSSLQYVWSEQVHVVQGSMESRHRCKKFEKIQEWAFDRWAGHVNRSHSPFNWRNPNQKMDRLEHAPVVEGTLLLASGFWWAICNVRGNLKYSRVLWYSWQIETLILRKWHTNHRLSVSPWLNPYVFSKRTWHPQATTRHRHILDSWWNPHCFHAARDAKEFASSIYLSTI